MDAPSDVALFVFTPSQAARLVEGLGYKIRKGNVLDASGKQVHFFCCEKPATVKKLGRVMPGSLELICDDLLCLNRYALAPVSD